MGNLWRNFCRLVVFMLTSDEREIHFTADVFSTIEIVSVLVVGYFSLQILTIGNRKSRRAAFCSVRQSKFAIKVNEDNRPEQNLRFGRTEHLSTSTPETNETRTSFMLDLFFWDRRRSTHRKSFDFKWRTTDQIRTTSSTQQFSFLFIERRKETGRISLFSLC